jgi:hypothetical protein
MCAAGPDDVVAQGFFTCRVLDGTQPRSLELRRASAV